MTDITATVELTCDNCSDTTSVDLADPFTIDRHAPKTVEEAIESEGWQIDYSPDRLLCDACVEAEDLEALDQTEQAHAAGEARS